MSSAVRTSSAQTSPLGDLAAVVADDLAHRVHRDHDVAALAQVVDGPFPGDPEHPAAQRQVGVVAFVDPPDLVEHPLQDVLDVRVRHVPGEVGRDQRAEGAVALLERLGLPWCSRAPTSSRAASTMIVRTAPGVRFHGDQGRSCPAEVRYGRFTDVHRNPYPAASQLGDTRCDLALASLLSPPRCGRDRSRRCPNCRPARRPHGGTGNDHRHSAPLDHIFVIMLENHSQSSVIDDPNAPYLTRLAHGYGMADHYYGVTHPSMPNYIASIAGDNFGIQDDNDQNVVNLDRVNLVDQLEAHHISWDAYMENLPADKLASFGPSQAPTRCTRRSTTRSCCSTTSRTTRRGWRMCATTPSSAQT